MLEKLSDDQLLSVAIISHVYYHDDPIRLLTDALSADNTGYINFWIDTWSGSILCGHFPDTLTDYRNMPIVPVHSVSVSLVDYFPEHTGSEDLLSIKLLPDVIRDEISSSFLFNLVHFIWENVNISKVFDIQRVSKTRALILDSCNTKEDSQNECFEKVLNNIVMPVLMSGITPSTKYH